MIGKAVIAKLAQQLAVDAVHWEHLIASRDREMLQAFGGRSVTEAQKHFGVKANCCAALGLHQATCGSIAVGKVYERRPSRMLGKELLSTLA